MTAVSPLQAWPPTATTPRTRTCESRDAGGVAMETSEPSLLSTGRVPGGYPSVPWCRPFNSMAQPSTMFQRQPRVKEVPSRFFYFNRRMESRVKELACRDRTRMVLFPAGRGPRRRICASRSPKGRCRSFFPSQLPQMARAALCYPRCPSWRPSELTL